MAIVSSHQLRVRWKQNVQLKPFRNSQKSKSIFELISVLWDPAGQMQSVIVLGYKAIGTFDLDSNTYASFFEPTSGNQSIQCASWDPHDSNGIVIGVSGDLITHDIRSNHPSQTKTYAHDLSIRCIDHNPNKPTQFASSGDDCIIRIWDSRNLSTAMEIRHHSHWVWNLAYNQSHDQLLLSSSSDCNVNLESIVSVSSVPQFLYEDEEEGSKTVDGLVAGFEEHEESVYGVSWSCGDPWIFASVSWDGRVVVNQVPKEHKYKIIL